MSTKKEYVWVLWSDEEDGDWYIEGIFWDKQSALRYAENIGGTYELEQREITRR